MSNSDRAFEIQTELENLALRIFLSTRMHLNPGTLWSYLNIAHPEYIKKKLRNMKRKEELNNEQSNL